MTAPAPTGSRVAALADDLSGAAETAAALAGLPSLDRGPTLDNGPAATALTVDLVLAGGPAGPAAAESATVDVHVVDLDDRGHTPAVAGRTRFTAVRTFFGSARSAQSDMTRFVKIDSQLRGNVAAATRALVDSGFVPVLAPALPEEGRTVVGGRVLVHGEPLADSPTWRNDPLPAPPSVAHAVDLPSHQLNLEDVAQLATDRGRASDLVATAAATGAAVVADAERNEDLDRVVTAFGALAGVVLVGSAGLAAALGRTLGHPGPRPTRPVATPPGRALVVVGTAEPVALRQVQELVDDSARRGRVVTVVELPSRPTRLDHAQAQRQVEDGLSAGVAVLRTTALDGPRDPERSRELAEVAAAVAAGDRSTALVLLGGDTARRTCDALGLATLSPQREVHHGAVLCTTPDGRTVVVRPGSFGSDTSLRDIVTLVLAPHPLLREALT